MQPSEVPDEIVADLCGDSLWNSPVTFIAPDDLTFAEQAQVPAVWLVALRASGRAGLGLMLDEWDRVLPGRLPKLTARFREAGVDLILGRQSGVPVLVYVLAGLFGDRQYNCWTATPPVLAVPEHLRELPRDVSAFHTRLHDELESPWMGGMMPIADLEPVSTLLRPELAIRDVSQRGGLEQWTADAGSGRAAGLEPGGPHPQRPGFAAVVRNAQP
jgi:hypothetical protein